MLKLADNITTDHIMPAGAKILPLRSNIPAISEYVFSQITDSFARIHKANLINFGIVPLTFAAPDDYDRIEQGAEVVIPGIREAILSGAETLAVEIGGRIVQARCELSRRHREIIAAGGLLNWAR